MENFNNVDDKNDIEKLMPIFGIECALSPSEGEPNCVNFLRLVETSSGWKWVDILNKDKLIDEYMAHDSWEEAIDFHIDNMGLQVFTNVSQDNLAYLLSLKAEHFQAAMRLNGEIGAFLHY